MDPYFIDLLEPVVILGTLLGLAFGVKLLVWGKGPLRRGRHSAQHPELEQRVAELEARSERLAERLAEQAGRLEDYDERLDFAERVLTRQRADRPTALEAAEEHSGTQRLTPDT